jgi:uncharacterized protein (DUF433 family)
MSRPWHQIITVELGKRRGQPCVRGMRITVGGVLSYLASGMSQDEVLEDFPYLTHGDILACLTYAANQQRNVWLLDTRSPSSDLPSA